MIRISDISAEEASRAKDALSEIQDITQTIRDIDYQIEKIRRAREVHIEVHVAGFCVSKDEKFCLDLEAALIKRRERILEKRNEIELVFDCEGQVYA
jgi:cytidylate kinase